MSKLHIVETGFGNFCFKDLQSAQMFYRMANEAQMVDHFYQCGFYKNHEKVRFVKSEIDMRVTMQTIDETMVALLVTREDIKQQYFIKEDTSGLPG